MKAKILSALSHESGFISGQELCDRFGVSRTAVWKAVQALEKDGYQIEAVRNKGYRLLSVPDILTVESCTSAIHGEWAGCCVEVYDSIDSTNRRAKELGESGAVHGTLIVADCQTAGKGRRGRNWETPPGVALSFSLLLRPGFLPDKASMLTLIAAVAVERAVRDMTGCAVSIKWPNDVVLNHRKICGILTEMSTELDSIHYVVIGIGINIAQKSFPPELKEKATSILMESGNTVNRSALLARILEEFEKLYTVFAAAGDLSDIRAEYEAVLAGLGSPVVIEDEQNRRSGICRGITKNGALRVETQDGRIEEIISGEVSVRGIYGYI